MIDPWPIAHAVQRALQRAGLDAGSERVGASNWIVSVSLDGRRGALRIAPADTAMLRDDVVALLDDAGWNARDGLADIPLMAQSSAPFTDRIRQAVAAACSHLGADSFAHRTALAALDEDLREMPASDDLIRIAEHAVGAAGIDADTPLPSLVSDLAERLRPFSIPLTRLNAVAWRLAIEAIGPAATHHIGFVQNASMGAREIVAKHLSELLISTPDAALDDVRAATWDLLQPYPLTWRTQQADWIEHWLFSPAWRTAIADSRLAGPRMTGIASLASSAPFRHIVRALEIGDRGTLAALALATFPLTGDPAWTVVSAAQASIAGPMSSPKLSEHEMHLVEPYRTSAELLQELLLTIDGDDPYSLTLRDVSRIESYRSAVDLTPAAAQWV